MGLRMSRFACQREALTIRGCAYLPPGDGPFPAAVVCHGFMANQSTVRQYARTLAATGWAAYTFDFCGGCVLGGKSDGATCDMSVLTEVRDLLAVIRCVQAQPCVQPGKLLLCGHSQGGLVAALTAAHLGDQVTHLALLAPALCIPDDARAGQMMMAKFDPADVPERIRCGPMLLGRQYVTDVQGMDPFAEITSYPGDVLIIHGGRDQIVAPSYAIRARDAYAARAVGSAELLMLESAGPVFTGAGDRAVIQRLKTFAAL